MSFCKVHCRTVKYAAFMRLTTNATQKNVGSYIDIRTVFLSHISFGISPISAVSVGSYLRAPKPSGVCSLKGILNYLRGSSAWIDSDRGPTGVEMCSWIRDKSRLMQTLRTKRLKVLEHFQRKTFNKLPQF